MNRIRWCVIAGVVTVGCSSSGGDTIARSTAADTTGGGSTATAVAPDDDGDPACSGERDEDRDDSADRAAASNPVGWRDDRFDNADVVSLKLLGVNDFHGQITTGKTSKINGIKHPVGSAPVLAWYLRNAMAQSDSSFVVMPGDLVGASPPASALLGDEPAIMFFNELTSSYCGNDADPNHKKCNVISTLGNHEFDKGKAELLRKVYGGNAANGPFLQDPWAGANYPYVCANAVDSATGQPLFAPYVIADVHGERVAFIGAVTSTTPTIVLPSGVAGTTFLDEAQSINKYIPEIQQQNVHAIVVLIHEGGNEKAYNGQTQPGSVTGRISQIVQNLDDDVDVVMSGHTHNFSNALVSNAHGKPMLVTQAFSYSTAFSNVDIRINRATHDVAYKSAAIQTTWAEASLGGPGANVDPTAQALVDAALAKVGPLINAVVGSASIDETRAQSSGGEENLGDVIADAQRAAFNDAQFAFMNPGGIRADVPAGTITWGELFSVQPFANILEAMNVTGSQIKTLLEEQWMQPPGATKMLQISGLSYTWSASAPVGSRVVSITANDGSSVWPSGASNTYRIVVNNFMGGGGDNFVVLKNGTNVVPGPVDLDALVNWVQAKSPISQTIQGRATVVP